MSDKGSPVVVNSQYVWKLLFNYDNSNNSGEIVQTRAVSIKKKISSESTYTSVFQAAMSSSFKATIGANFEIKAFEVGTAGGKEEYEFQTKVDLSTEVKKSITESKEVNEEKTETFSWTVGAKSKLAVYQLFFEAAGISESYSVFSTDTSVPVVIPVTYWLVPKKFIVGIEVVYGDQPSQMPGDVVQEVSGQSNDVNSGYGGKFVWLRAIYTTDVKAAVTGFQTVHQGNADNKYSDLAKGAGGDFRYLIPLHDAAARHRLTNVVLFRSSHDAINNFGDWQGHTSDINAGRGKDFLYLAWKQVGVVLDA